MAADGVGRKVVGDAAGLEPGLHALQRLDHFRAQVAGKKGQNVLAANLCAQRQRFDREQFVEGFDIDLGAFELRPGVFQMVGGVGAPDDIGRQPALGLESRKRLEGRSGQHPAEVPDHSLDHYSLPERNALGSG